MKYETALAWARKRTGPWQARDIRAGLGINAKLSTWYCMELVRRGGAVKAGFATYKTARGK